MPHCHYGNRDKLLSGKVVTMTMYQVMDEENHCIATFHHFQEAMYTAQDFTLWDDEHYYHVEELDMAVA